MKESLEIRGEGLSLGPEGMHVRHLTGALEPGTTGKIRRPALEPPAPAPPEAAAWSPVEYERQISELNLKLSAVRGELTIIKSLIIVSRRESLQMRADQARSLNRLSVEVEGSRDILHRLDWPNRLWSWIVQIFNRKES